MVRLLRVDSPQMCRVYCCLLQFVEGGLVHGCPLAFEVSLEHSGESSCCSLESFDKMLIESTETDRLSNSMDSGGRRPTSDDLDLLRVPVYFIFVYDVSAKVTCD